MGEENHQEQPFPAEYSNAVVPILGFFANAYVINGKRLTLVDSGAPRVAHLAKAAISKLLGREISAVDSITATHWHVDHVGGISEAIRQTGADLHLSARIAYHLENGGRIIYPRIFCNETIMPDRSGIKKPKFRLRDLLKMDFIGLPLQRRISPRFKAKRYFKDGENLPGHPEWKVIETPGHSPDSVCFWHEETGTLISGDTINCGTLGPVTCRFVWNEEEYAKSIAKLKTLNVRRILPGHGCILEGDDLMSKIVCNFNVKIASPAPSPMPLPVE
ncbi:MAG: MBL fold metallo-hydrolase [Candidatus Thermoplasmatota archaeon]|nr:MBL fold metallo-hydrolase [Candidatus Thermoplasmatota archaeon]